MALTRAASRAIVLAGLAASVLAAPSSGRPVATAAAAPSVISAAPRARGSTRARFSGTVNPQGVETSAYFEYGLDPRYTESGKLVFDNQTLSLPVGSDSEDDPVSTDVSGLVPNALYHVRLVAVSSGGKTVGPDETFMTMHGPAPPAPVLGKSVDTSVVSGVVFVKPPRGASLGSFRSDSGPAKGRGFVALTEARQVPLGSQFDTRRGAVQLTAATASAGKLQSGVFGAGLFKIAQQRRGITKGLTTLSLVEGSAGAPSYRSCKTGSATDTPTAHTARLSRHILNTLHARDNHGSFRTKGRYSAGTVRGTQWDTTDRCDGTLTTVKRGTVQVTDFRHHKTVLVHAHHTYLATAINRHR